VAQDRRLQGIYLAAKPHATASWYWPHDPSERLSNGNDKWKM